jgi:hypothetical protein
MVAAKMASLRAKGGRREVKAQRAAISKSKKVRFARKGGAK